MLKEQVRAIDEAAVAEDPVSTPKAQEMSRDEREEKKALLGQLEDKFFKSRDYNLDKNSFSFVSMGFSLAFSFGMLVSGFNVWLWDSASELVWKHAGSENEIVVSIAFLFAQNIVNTLVQLPLSIFNTFKLEEKHGFNKTTPWTFATDLWKGLVVENIILLPLMACVIKLVRWGGALFWVYVWALLFLFSILMLVIYPNFIMPLFNSFEPLPDGKLKDEIEKLASKVHFPLTKLFVMDGSKRSAHSNAFLYGFFGQKRIVLFDTLMKNEQAALQCTTDDIVAILAHEIGHWSLSHTLKGFIVQNLLYLAGLKAFGLFVNDPDVYASFGFVDQPVVVGLNLFAFIMTPLSSVLGFALNTLTRKFEYEADAYAVLLGTASALKSGLCKISIANLAWFDYDWAYSAMNHSHPALIERLRAIDDEESRLNKKKM